MPIELDYKNKEYLLEEYSRKKRSMTDIAGDFGKTHSVVRFQLEKFNIPKRTKAENMRLSNNSNWKGGRMKDNGYIKIRKPNHPFNNQGYVWEHILIIEKAIGRYVKKKEKIHHINLNKLDNRIENLDLMKNQKIHLKAHKSAYKIMKEWFTYEVNNGNINYNNGVYYYSNRA